MNCDVNIMSVENVFYRRESKWTRNICKIRHYDAVVFFTEGEIEYRFPRKTVVAKKGDLLFLPGNLPYSGTRRSAHCSYYVINFLCSNDKQLEGFGAPLAFAAASYPKVLQQFETIMQLWNHPSNGMMIELKAQLYTLLSERFFPKEKTDKQSNENYILQYIEKNLHDPTLSVARICKELYISDSKLRRCVHKLTGTSANEYIMILRLNKAKVMLSASDETIKDISYACGFSSPCYFSRVFSKSTGMSPSVYRMRTTE